MDALTETARIEREPTRRELAVLYAELGSTRLVAKRIGERGFERSHEWVRERIADEPEFIQPKITAQQFREDLRRFGLRLDRAIAHRRLTRARYDTALIRGGVGAEKKQAIVRDERRRAIVQDVSNSENELRAKLGSWPNSAQMQRLNRRAWMRMWRGFGSWETYQRYRRALQRAARPQSRSRMGEKPSRRRGGSRAVPGATPGARLRTTS